MGAFDPAYRIGEVERVLILKLVSRRCGADLETRRTEREFVDGRGDTVCWAVDAEISGCDRWHVNEAVVDMHQAKAKIVDQGRRKKVRFIDAEKPRVNRNVIGKIQVGSADAARQCSAERSLQTARAKGQHRFRIGKEKSR